MTCSLYRFYAAGGQLLYVGITGVGPTRFSAHRHDKAWWSLVARIDVEHYPTREEAAIAEVAAIKAERPRFNIAHSERRELEPIPGCCEWCGEPLEDAAADRFCTVRHMVLSTRKARVS